MKKLLLHFLLYSVAASAQPSADPIEPGPAGLPVSNTKYFFKIGERKLTIQVQQYGEIKDLAFINMHDDENASVEATKSLLEKRGGMLIEIENFEKRNIQFRMKGTTYTFDPNRIFTRAGTRQTLEFFRKEKVPDYVIDEVELLGKWLIRLMPADAKCVIALHNNTNGNFTINDFLPGRIRNDAAEKAFAAPGQDGDDLFFTTDAAIYNDTKKAGYNTILQANKTARDDGSLSIYYGRRNMRYVNCETEHGKVQQYREMMSALINILDEDKPKEVFYNFSVTRKDSLQPVAIEKGAKIFFNDQEVGEITSIVTDENSIVSAGQFQLKKEFSIYSNSDFFLIRRAASTPVIEIRIDPTRQKNSFNPQKDQVSIIVR